MAERNRIVIYQMLVRLFSNTKQTNKNWGTIDENGSGKFEDITSGVLKKLRSMGYTHVWYTGVIEHACLTDYSDFGIPANHPHVVKGRAGSPYAIRDYYDVHPDYAVKVNHRMSEFEALIDRTHGSDLKLIIDFVPNHLAREYHSDVRPGDTVDFGFNDDQNKRFDNQNNFYYLGEKLSVPGNYEPLGIPRDKLRVSDFHEAPAKASGNDVFSSSPGINDWFETVKLNYGVDYENNKKGYFDPIPDTWTKMLDVLLYWAAKGVDGFRCDMAEMVPTEFWHWVIPKVKEQYENIIFISEAYDHSLYRPYLEYGNFDYLYDKVDLYDLLKDIIQGRRTTDSIPGIWQKQDGIVDRMLRFLENHDEQRIASSYFAGDPVKGIPMMAITSFMHKGPIMMYMGQDVGEPAIGSSGFSGDDGRTTIFDYWSVPEHVKWVNGGKFDGGLLSPEQKILQARYTKILQTCNESMAIREGAFFDLHYYNRSPEFTGFSDQVYAFIRYYEEERLLIIVNLGDISQDVRIKIPELAFHMMKVETNSVAIGTQRLEVNLLSDRDTAQVFQAQIDRFEYVIEPIKTLQG
jgi:glycosidase